MCFLYFWLLCNKRGLVTITLELYFENIFCGSSGEFLFSKGSLFIIFTKVEKGSNCTRIWVYSLVTTIKYKCIIVELQNRAKLRFGYPLGDIQLLKRFLPFCETALSFLAFATKACVLVLIN